MTILPLRAYTPNLVPPERRTAREGGTYAQPKIEAFTRYCLAAEKVFKGQLAQGRIENIVHFEPFCGPGWNRIKGGQRRFKGTPLRTVEELKHYTTFVFNDHDSHLVDCLYSELVERGFDKNPNVRVYLSAMDANDVVRELNQLFPFQTRQPFPLMGTAIVDPEDLRFLWTSTESLARHRLDLLAMIPTDIDLKRNVKNQGARSYIQAWLGTEPISDVLSEVITQFQGRLETLYSEVHGPTTGGDLGMQSIWINHRYHLIAASHASKKVASRIWNGVVLKTMKEISGMPLEGLGLE